MVAVVAYLAMSIVVNAVAGNKLSASFNTLFQSVLSVLIDRLRAVSHSAVDMESLRSQYDAG